MGMVKENTNSKKEMNKAPIQKTAQQKHIRSRTYFRCAVFPTIFCRASCAASGIYPFHRQLQRLQKIHQPLRDPFVAGVAGMKAVRHKTLALRRNLGLDAAGAESILDDFLRLGKIESRFVSVAVNNKPRSIDLLHMTYAQQSIIGSGGYMPEDVRDVQRIMSESRWNFERIITHEFPLSGLEQAIRTAGNVDHAGNVVVKMKT